MISTNRFIWQQLCPLESFTVEAFWHFSLSASQPQSSVHCILWALQEQFPLHILLLQPHLPSCRTDWGASGILVKIGFNSPLQPHDQPSSVGSKRFWCAVRVCSHTWLWRCALLICSCIAPCVGGSFSTPFFVHRNSASEWFHPFYIVPFSRRIMKHISSSQPISTSSVVLLSVFFA